MGEDLLVKPAPPETGPLTRLLSRAGLDPADAVLAWDVDGSRWRIVVGFDPDASRLAGYSRLAAQITTDREAELLDGLLLVDKTDAPFGKLKAAARRRAMPPAGVSFSVEGRELLDPVYATDRATSLVIEVAERLKTISGGTAVTTEDPTGSTRADLVAEKDGMVWCFEVKAGNLPVSARSVIQLAGQVHLMQQRLDRPVRGVLVVEAPLTAQARNLLSTAQDLKVVDWSRPGATDELRAALA